MTSPVPHALTMSQVSVTKAGGLSDTPGAESSPNGKDGDTMKLSPRLMPAPSMAFIYIPGMNDTM